jgi:hypothetical protein
MNLIFFGLRFQTPPLLRNSLHLPEFLYFGFRFRPISSPAESVLFRASRFDVCGYFGKGLWELESSDGHPR